MKAETPGRLARQTSHRSQQPRCIPRRARFVSFCVVLMRWRSPDSPASDLGVSGTRLLLFVVICALGIAVLVFLQFRSILIGVVSAVLRRRVIVVVVIRRLKINGI